MTEAYDLLPCELLPETAAMEDLSVHQMPLYEVDRLKTQTTHCARPRVGQTNFSTGFKISRALKREKRNPANKDMETGNRSDQIGNITCVQITFRGFRPSGVLLFVRLFRKVTWGDFRLGRPAAKSRENKLSCYYTQYNTHTCTGQHLYTLVLNTCTSRWVFLSRRGVRRTNETHPVIKNTFLWALK